MLGVLSQFYYCQIDLVSFTVIEMNSHSRLTSSENLQQGHGSNLYPVTLKQRFGDLQIDLDVPEGVWNPTPHGIHLGNMLLGIDFTGKNVLELGTGCGIHAILIAHRGAAQMTMTEIDAVAIENSKHNFAKNTIDIEAEFIVADWTAVPGASHEGKAKWDCIVTNPPFAKSGKHYRRYFIDSLILDAHKLVKPGGELIFVQSSMADIPRSVQLMEDCKMAVHIVGETEGPFRDYYYEDDTFMQESANVQNGFEIRDGVHYERLIVFRAVLPK